MLRPAESRVNVAAHSPHSPTAPEPYRSKAWPFTTAFDPPVASAEAHVPSRCITAILTRMARLSSWASVQRDKKGQEKAEALMALLALIQTRNFPADASKNGACDSLHWGWCQ
jgi:hypothetical protein